MLTGQQELMTPEGVSLALTPAGPVLRATAWLIDFILWYIFILVIYIFFSIIFGHSHAGSGIYLVVLFISYWGYPILFEVYGNGMTLGKRWMGLQVLRNDGLPVGWRESGLRNLLLVADFLPVLYFSGLLCMLQDTHFRRLGDMVANTMVVYRQKKFTPKEIRDGQPDPLPFALNPEEQRALLDFVERASRLPEARRLELADIASPLTQKTGFESLAQLRNYAAGLTR